MKEMPLALARKGSKASTQPSSTRRWCFQFSTIFAIERMHISSEIFERCCAYVVVLASGRDLVNQAGKGWEGPGNGQDMGIEPEQADQLDLRP